MAMFLHNVFPPHTYIKCTSKRYEKNLVVLLTIFSTIAKVSDQSTCTHIHCMIRCIHTVIYIWSTGTIDTWSNKGYNNIENTHVNGCQNVFTHMQHYWSPRPNFLSKKYSSAPVKQNIWAKSLLKDKQLLTTNENDKHPFGGCHQKAGCYLPHLIFEWI